MAAPLSREQYDKLPRATREQLGPYPEETAKPRARAVREGERPIRKVRRAAPKATPKPKLAPKPRPRPAPVRVHTTPSGNRRLVTPLSGGLSVGEVDQAVLVAAGVGLLVLYIRGVPQALWAAATTSPAAARRPPTSATIPGGSSGGGAAGGGAPSGWWGEDGVFHPAAASATPPATGSGLAAAANRHLGERTQPSGESWIDWCLKFVDNIAASLGIDRKRDATAAADAQDTAAFGPLQHGTPPPNAIVYFSPNHVGISNGDGTYTSAGLPGGVQRLPINWNTLLGWRYA